MMRLGIVSLCLFLIALAPLALGDAPAPARVPGPATDAVPDDPVRVAALEAAPGTLSEAAADSGFATVFDFGYEDSETGTPVSVIFAGQTVTWFWTEGIHSVTEGVANEARVVPPQFDSGIKRPTDENPFFTASFSTPGVYAYYCTLHPSMHGTVVAI